MRWRLSGTNWILSNSLIQLAKQLDEAYPERHAADGTLGNAAHSARTSDHNPDDNRIVHALDQGEVVENDAFNVAEAIRISKDRRIKYVIHEGRMYSSYWKNVIPPFTWRPYSGTNMHTNHTHYSVLTVYDNDVSPWAIGGGDDMAILTDNEQVELQKFLAELRGVNSNVSFVRYLIPWYRKWRRLSPLSFLKRGDKVEIV